MKNDKTMKLTKQAFKIGDFVELVGVYKKDKLRGFFRKPYKYKGKITDHSLDLEAPSIGGSMHVYVVDGVGTYGESALRLSHKNKLFFWRQ